MRTLVVILLACFSLSCIAEKEEAEVHSYAHLGMAYAVNSFSYGFYKKMFKMPRGPALIFANVVTTAVCLSYEATKPTRQVNGNALLMDAVGMTLSNVTIFVFEF